jgi:hypothetical protein
MKSCIIHDLPGWRVTSWGNGLAYAIECKATGADYYVQGESADIWRDEFERLTTEAPALSFSDALRVLWSEYVEGVE